LKSTFLYGNILVAFCLALVPLVGIYIQSGDGSLSLSVSTIHYYAWGISFFAFLSSLIREIVKDMEDVEGDSAAGCKTIPIVIGLNKTKVVVQLLVLLIVIMIGVFQRFLYTIGTKPDIIYCALFIQLPCLIVLWKMQKASSSKDYKRVSGWLKLIMVTGISYFFVFTFEVWVIVQLFKSFIK
jgi:4-hydroxybenzoate polyprenyltransferase